MYSSIINHSIPSKILKSSEDLGVSLAQKLLNQGAGPILKAAKEATAKAILEQNEAKQRAKVTEGSKVKEESKVKEVQK